MKKRVVELDVLRGLSILGMILVITPGSWSHRFSWMLHAEWQGYPISDMIFPSFLFCVGMSMAISFHKREHKGDPDFIFFSKVVRRVLLLIFIGLIINGFPFFEFKQIRIPGVLQRIAFCYFIVASIWIFLKSKKIKREVLWLSIFSFFILVAYTVLLYLIPVPEIGITGHSSEKSWPVLIDQKVFGIHHLWEYGITNGKVTYDPEGILASFPASVNVTLGLIIGILYTKHRNIYRLRVLASLGIILLAIGFCLDTFLGLPIIKKIWTSSFVFFSGGVSILILVTIRFLLVVLPKINVVFYPFIVYGANAILAFVLSNILMTVFDLPITIKEKSIRIIGFDFFSSFISSDVWASFSFSVIFLIGLFFLLEQLYKKSIFLRV